MQCCCSVGGVQRKHAEACTAVLRTATIADIIQQSVQPATYAGCRLQPVAHPCFSHERAAVAAQRVLHRHARADVLEGVQGHRFCWHPQAGLCHDAQQPGLLQECALAG